MSNQRRPDVQELRPATIADLPCHLHGSEGRRELKYTEPFKMFDGRVVNQPHILFEGVKPFGLIIRLMELYRAAWNVKSAQSFKSGTTSTPTTSP